jgi:hypothetical protein
MEKENKGQLIKIFKFNEAYEAPTYKYNKSSNFVEWGKDNNYPAYILNLYNNYGSTTHKSVINKKVKMIAGNGLSTINDDSLAAFVDNNGLEEELKRVALDYELFNGFAFEIIWDNAGEKIVSIAHMPLNKLRIGIQTDEIDKPYFWFSNDWIKYKKDEYSPMFITSFDGVNKSGKQIVYFSEYNPSCDGLYPIPGYSTSINWIEMDYQISKFHLNQVKQGYSPSFMLNFATGIPTEEEQDGFFREFKKNFAGSENAGKIIMTYSEGKEQAPELTKVDLNDSDKRFNLLKEQIDDNIVRGAEIPPQLVILTPGKLGSTDERQELMAEFQDAYISQRQNTIERVLNDVLFAGGFKEDITLQTYLGEKVEEEVVVDDAQAQAQAVLKGSAGGVQALLQIQTSVAAGTTSRSSAQATIELIYGFSPEEASRLLGDVQEGQSAPETITENINDSVGEE